MKTARRIKQFVQGYSGEDASELDYRFMRLRAIDILRREGLAAEDERKAIKLLLGINGALTKEELKRLCEKMTQKRFNNDVLPRRNRGGVS